MRESKHKYTIRMYKSDDAAVILSLVLGLLTIYGVGQLYLHKIKRGIALLLVGIFLPTIFIISALLLYSTDDFDKSDMLYLILAFLIFHIGFIVWQAKDVSKLCTIYNETLLQDGRPPW